MVKKNYQKPSMKVVKLQHRSRLLDASPSDRATQVRGNAFDGDISSDEGYNGPTR
jgi:hypothetical protein